ncbi:MAG: ABC transporter permease [Clostridia bacterium]|nr:ABC transporter permease [Clostridia bacterium]
MSILNWLGALPGAAAQGIIWGIMAIGVYFTYKILDVADLTVDGSICTGGAVCAVLMTAGMDAWLAMLIAVVAGVLCGLLTGVFHTLMGIPAILAGILTQLILWSVNLKIMGQANMALPSRSFDVLVAASRVGVSLPILIVFVVVLIALLYCFLGTELGAALRSTGCNLNMSRAQGINVELIKVLGLALSNGVVALSGALLTQYQGFADINMGRGAIVIGLAAVIIGEVVTSRLANSNFVKKIGIGYAFRLLGVVIGGVIYFFVYQTVVFLGLDTDLLKMLSALVVAVFLAVPYWKKKYLSSPHKKAAVSAGCTNDAVKEDESNA